MNRLMKDSLFAVAIAAFSLTTSCQKIGEEKTPEKEPEKETVSVKITYSITTDNGQLMPGTKASNSDVFNEFYQKIKSGDLVAPNYSFTFTEKNTGAIYKVNGTWAGKDMITLRTGSYKVVGTSTASGDNVQSKCSLLFDDDIVVDVNSKTITLKAKYDCSLIIFSDASIAKLSNFNGNSSTDLFKFNNYIYAFIHTTLYAEGKQDQAYLEGLHTNDTQFKIYTGKLNYEIGKYYVYNDINAAFDIDKMDEGGSEGGDPIDLSSSGTANCYVVEEAGVYKFNASIIGNGNAGIITNAGFHSENASITPSDATILWDDNSIISSVSYSDGYISFTATGNLGNAVIAAKDASGEVLWSWHIWSTKDIQTIECYNGDFIMDRNLGAKKGSSSNLEDIRGLFYQWGRKDPIRRAQSNMVESSESTGTIPYSIKHPDTMITGFDSHSIDNYRRGSWIWGSAINNQLWGNPNSSASCTKTIYDPCPNGYKMQSLSTWNGVERISDDNNGCFFQLNSNGNTSYFLYGCIRYDGLWLDYDDCYNAPAGRQGTSCCFGGDNSLIGSVVFLGSVFFNLNNGDFRADALNVRCVRE